MMETELEKLKRQVSELEDVAASLRCNEYTFWDELCRIIFEGENNTKFGLDITMDRLKDRLNYLGWLENSIDDDE